MSVQSFYGGHCEHNFSRAAAAGGRARARAIGLGLAAEARDVGPVGTRIAALAEEKTRNTGGAIARKQGRRSRWHANMTQRRRSLYIVIENRALGQLYPQT